MRFWQRQSDARRTTRWLLAGFALCVASMAVAVHLGLSLAWWLLTIWWPTPLDYPAGFAAVNVGLTLLLVLGGWWLETDRLRAGGGRQLAQRIGARPAQPSASLAEQQLCGIVQEMSLAAQMTPPQVLARAAAINAFAAGWDAEDAVIAVTQGSLAHLSRAEMQGLVAHELSHLHEGDTRLNMRLAGMVFGLELVYGFGEQLRERGGLAWWFGSAVMAAGWVGWLCGELLKAAVSRQREFLADARAVQWTRQRDGLGGVLRKLMTQREQAAGYLGGWQADRGSHQGLNLPMLQHMLLAEVPQHGDWAQKLESHPPLEERVRRIYGRPMRGLPLSAAGLSGAANPG